MFIVGRPFVVAFGRPARLVLLEPLEPLASAGQFARQPLNELSDERAGAACSAEARQLLAERTDRRRANEVGASRSLSGRQLIQVARKFREVPIRGKLDTCRVSRTESFPRPVRSFVRSLARSSAIMIRSERTEAMIGLERRRPARICHLLLVGARDPVSRPHFAWSKTTLSIIAGQLPSVGANETKIGQIKQISSLASSGRRRGARLTFV